MSLNDIPEDKVVLADSNYVGDTFVPDCSLQPDGEDFMEKLLLDKKTEPSKFQSYWEKDENDIDTWTKVSFKKIN